MFIKVPTVDQELLNKVLNYYLSVLHYNLYCCF